MASLDGQELTVADPKRPVSGADRNGGGPEQNRTQELTKGMLQPPESTPSSLASPAPEPNGRPLTAAAGIGDRGTPPQQRIPRWLVRMELFLRVMLRMYIGLAICYVPWSHTFWDQNPLFAQFPTLGIYAANGAVRGMVSGLGLLNLWIAFQDALRHRDG